MNQQQEARRAAAQAFHQALEQLQQSLEPTDVAPAPAVPVTSPVAADANLPAEGNLPVWEDAIADIEQFMQDLATSDS